jgi:hypothetical protein
MIMYTRAAFTILLLGLAKLINLDIFLHYFIKAGKAFIIAVINE